MRFRHKGMHEIEQLQGTVKCIVKVDGTLFQTDIQALQQFAGGLVCRDNHTLTNKGLRFAGRQSIDYLARHPAVGVAQTREPVTPTIKKGRVIFA